MAESVKVATEEGAKVTTTVTASDATAAAPAEPDDIEAARARIARIMGAITETTNSAFVVGCDGSISSETAMNTCLSLMKPKDFLTALHFYDSTKNIGTFDPKYGHNALRDKYTLDLTAKMRSKRWHLDWQDKAGQKTCDIVARYLNGLADKADYLAFTQGKAPEFFVCGFRGRKAVTEVGSVADLAMRRLHIPVIIVKENYVPKPLDAPRTFVACVKNEKANMPYEIAVSLMKPKDRLFVYCIYTTDSDVGGAVAATKEYYESDMAHRGIPNTRMDMVPDVPGKTVVDMINEYASEHDADFVVVVPSADATTLSSNCEALIRLAKTNLVICKK